MKPRVEEFAERLSPLVTAAVRGASAAKVNSRQKAAESYFGGHLNEAREFASQTKDFVLDHLAKLLPQFEQKCIQNGIQVHWAESGEDACSIALEILSKSGLENKIIAKGKSMVTEEIHLNHALETAGYEPVETDLGEFVVQLDHDTPSHIVTPIIHKTRFDVAKTFSEHHIGPYSEDATELTMQARSHLREKFRTAACGMSGVNFGIVETGRLAIVENEGNNRLSTTAPPLHIAFMGIEKLLPRESDLPIFLRLLALSSTGQQMTTYVHLISGASQEDEVGGPKEVHLILVDNGRTKALKSRFRDALKCIRCGACLNVCPVYRASSGHAYGHTYPGPIGAILVPALESIEEFGDLAFSSTLCGACEEVCPVKIPIADLLVKIRSEQGKDWRWFGMAAQDAGKWKFGLKALPMVSGIPNPMAAGWSASREIPERQGREFRRWWNGRSR